MAQASDWQLASLIEAVADGIPDRTMLVQGTRRVTYAECDARASRLSAALAALGAVPDAKLAIYMHNCPEYKEAELAIAKLRGVAVSVNYRFVADELVYLLDDADAEIVLYQRKFADRIRAISQRLPRVRRFIEVDDEAPIAPFADALDYEMLIRDHPPAPRIARSGTDTVITYTGGTTGMPKGVLFTHEASLRFTTIGYEFYDLPVPGSVEQLVAAAKRLADAGKAPVSLVCAPFMHSIGSTLGHTMTLMMGGTVVLLTAPSFSAEEAWDLVQREKVTQIVLVGDAIARPLLEALDAALAAGRPYDIASLRLIASSGVMWTREVKQGLLAHHDMKLIDVLGSSEGGMGFSVANRAQQPETAQFRARPGLKLLDEDDTEIPWGAGRPGRIATTGNIPHGYHKDPAKTAQTFREIGGTRYSIPGDYALIDHDGRITMMGRGSSCINTGGEKVFAEEVEEALKRHPRVRDCLVVGVPDARLGEAVTALVAFTSGLSADPGELRDFVRSQLAGYKAPRHIVVVPDIQRAPNGKPDLVWAKQQVGAKMVLP